MGTLVEWIEPITDRTQEDVDLVKQLNQFSQNPEDMWYNNLKGALNRSDLLRIGNDIGILLELVGEETRFHHLYPATNLYPSTTLYPGTITYQGSSGVDVLYDPPELPTYSNYYSILRNYLYVLYSYSYYYSTTPPPPPDPYNTYETWNDVETFLKDMYSVLTESINSYSYTGTELYCGNSLI